MGPDCRSGILDDIVRTRVGCTAGRKQQPTSHNLGDHGEAVQLDFDPRCPSYGRLPQVARDEHHPASQPWSRQYRAAIFVHDVSQRAAAPDTEAAVRELSAQARQ